MAFGGLHHTQSHLVDVASPETPRRSKHGLISYLDELCIKLGIDLPFPRSDNITESPGNRPRSEAHDVVSQLRFLYFQDRTTLNKIVVELAAGNRRGDSKEATITALNKCLTGAVVMAKKQVLGSADRNRSGSLRTTDRVDEERVMAPPSPTLAVKHAPKFTSVAAVGAETTPPEDDTPLEPRKISFLPSASTSFATDMKTSFMSDATNKTTSDTPFTSFCVTNDGTDGKNASQMSDNHRSSIFPSVVDRLEVSAAALNSPARLEHWRVARITDTGLVHEDLAPTLTPLLSFDLRVEALRGMRATGLSPKAFEQEWRTPRTLSSLHKLVQRFTTNSRSFQPGCKTDYSKHTLNAKLLLSKAGPLLQMEFGPPREELATAYQRKFGGDRFLVVDMPSFRALPGPLTGQDIIPRIEEVLAKDQCFFGRRWVCFHLQEKKQKKLVAVDDTTPRAHQFTLFAVSGDDIAEINVTKLIDWAFPLYHGRNQTACKSFARLDLQASRSTPTYQFEANDILIGTPDPDGLCHGLADRLATDEKTGHEYDDPTFEFPEHYNSTEVMNDGCGEISVAAMHAIQSSLGLRYTPTAIQGRIAGAKGVWFISDGKTESSSESGDHWIKVHKSQVKAKHTIQSLENDPHLRTFNLVNHTRPAASSVLYPGFLPILKDRGVPDEAILNLARFQVNLETNKYLDALKEDRCLHDWIFSERKLTEMRARNSFHIQYTAGFPISSEERVVQLLGAGFTPQRNLYLKNEIFRVADMVISLPKSTSVIGIADPTGLLAPDEVVLNLSRGLGNAESEEALFPEHGVSVLVARNPSMRSSDIQRLRLVNIPALSHMRDVAIFSSRGVRPVAGKLSGGDYDGDTFWICWEQTLVKPFLNAPAPRTLRPLQALGLEQDTTKLHEVVKFARDGTPNEASVRSWIQRSAHNRLREQLLGKVTLCHQSWTYNEGSISSEIADILVDRHDLEVDNDKQGYRDGPDGFKNLKKRLGIPNNLVEPAHRKFTARAAPTEKTVQPTTCRYNSRNIVDLVYFTAVEPTIDSTKGKAAERFKDACAHDPDLSQFSKETKDSAPKGGFVDKMVRAVEDDIRDLERRWDIGIQKYHNNTSKAKQAEFDELVGPVREAYLAIAPREPSHPSAIDWTRNSGYALTLFDKLKASTLAHRHHGNGRMMFSIAGRELCRMKADFTPDPTRIVREDIYASLKPHKRGMAAAKDLQDSEDELDSDGDEYFAGQSVIEAFGDDEFGDDEFEDVVRKATIQQQSASKLRKRRSHEMESVEDSTKAKARRVEDAPENHLFPRDFNQRAQHPVWQQSEEAVSDHNSQTTTSVHSPCSARRVMKSERRGQSGNSSNLM